MMDETDRISSLPVCLIHLIMSFLTAQEAVRTSILSKTWKNIWTTLPFPDFDLGKFEHGTELYAEPDKFESFRNFTTVTLLCRETSNLHAFRLSCHEMCGNWYTDMYVSWWICYALKHNLQVLDINVSLDDLSVSFRIFTCASLVNVSIYDSINDKLNYIMVINLPCLKRLHLRSAMLNQVFVDKLFRGCPVLEFLHLEECEGDYYTINSQSLKYLKIEDDSNGMIADNLEGINLINTPNLLSFSYTNSAFIFCLNLRFKAPSLISASICIKSHDSIDFIDWKCKSNILNGLSDVKILNLSGLNIKDLLENELSNCPEFSNLKDLSVEGLCLSCHFSLLASFLSRCLNLEKLYLCDFGCRRVCQEEVHGNPGLLEILPFEGKRLETLEVELGTNDQTFSIVLKYLQDITKNSGAKINITNASYYSDESIDESSV